MLVRPYDKRGTAQTARDRAHDPRPRRIGMDHVSAKPPGHPRQGHTPGRELSHAHRRLEGMKAEADVDRG
jgi:hypothetical protein